MSTTKSKAASAVKSAQEVATRQAELAIARDALAEREREHAEAERGLASAVTTEDRERVVAARARRDDLVEIELPMARSRVERLEGELASAIDRQQLAERELLAGAARKAAAAYRDAVERDFPVITTMARRLLRLGAEAELAREAAVAAGAAELPRPDAFRDRPALPREEKGRRTLDLWINPWGGAPFDDAIQAEFRETSDGTGVCSCPGRQALTADERQLHEEVTYLPEERARIAPALAGVLVLPGLHADDPVGWRPLDNVGPTAVLAALDALDAAGPADRVDRRVVQTERKPLARPRDVRRPT